VDDSVTEDSEEGVTAGMEGFCEEMTTTLKSFPSVTSVDSGVVTGSAISVTDGEISETAEESVDSSADGVDGKG
jgi:hypothetical protein